MSPARTTSPRHFPAPSPALLGALRAIAPPSPNPLLPFLLPTNRVHRKRQNISASPTTSSSSTTMGIPEKYQPQSDGSWVPTECWELHGQQWCETPTSTYSCCNSPSPIVNLDDGGSSETAPTATTTSKHSPTSSPSPASTSPVVDISSLPKGWEPKTPRTKLYPIPVIVTSSIFLAFAIVVIIWICSITRKQRRIRHQALDIESHAKSKRIATDDDDDDDEKAQNPNAATVGHSTSRSVSAKSRRLRWRGIWYRSRKSRRQRNAQPHTSQHDVANSDAEEGDDDEIQATTSSHSYPSTPTARSFSHNDLEQLGEPPSLNPSVNSSNTSLPHTIESARDAPLASPPTYAFHQPARARNIPDSHEHDNDSLQAPPPHHSDLYSGALSLNEPAVQHQHQQGHVATDDKATLARMAQMRSAPPQSPSLSHPGATSNSGESSSITTAMLMIPVAPEWTDDLDFPPAPESKLPDESVPDPDLPHPDYHYGSRRSPIEGEAYRHSAAGSASSSSGKTLQDMYGAGRTNRATIDDYVSPADDNDFDDDGILRIMTEEEGEIPSPPPPWARHSSDDLFTRSLTLPAPPPLHPSIAREHARLRQPLSRDRAPVDEDDAQQQNTENEEEDEEAALHRALGLPVPQPHPSYTSSSSLSSSSIAHSSLHSSQCLDRHFSSIPSTLPQYPHSPGPDVDIDYEVGIDAPSAPPDEGPITAGDHSAVASAPPLEDDCSEAASYHDGPSAPPMWEEHR